MKKDVKFITEEQALRYMPNDYFQKDALWNKVRSTIDNNKFTGNFYSSLWQGGGDGYLYELDEHDDYLVRRQNLKEGERIYRYFTRRSAFTGQVPLIKINIDKGLLYFLKDDEGLDLIEFETKGIPVRYLNIIPPQNEEYAEGGKTENKVIGYDVRYERLVDGEYEPDKKYFDNKESAEKFAKEHYSYVEQVYEYAEGGSVDVIKKDRYGNDVKIGDAIHIRVLTGRYGQTKDYEGVVTNFDQFGMVELDGQRSLTYTKDYKFDDYEHGHHIWVEKIKEKDIQENLRVPKKYVSTYSGTINGEKFAINGKDKFQDWLDKNYPSSVLGAWNTLYNKGWKYKNSTKEYISPENLSYDMIDVYASAEQGQGFLYSLMIPKDKSEYAQGGMMTDGGGIGEPQDYHKLNMEFLKIFSEYGFINAGWDNHYINEQGDILSWSPKSKTIGKGWLIVRLSKTYPYEMHSERWVIKVYLKSYTINDLIKLFNEFNFKKGKRKGNLSFTPYYASGGMMADGGYMADGCYVSPS